MRVPFTIPFSQLPVPSSRANRQASEHYCPLRNSFLSLKDARTASEVSSEIPGDLAKSWVLIRQKCASFVTFGVSGNMAWPNFDSAAETLISLSDYGDLRFKKFFAWRPSPRNSPYKDKQKFRSSPPARHITLNSICFRARSASKLYFTSLPPLLTLFHWRKQWLPPQIFPRYIPGLIIPKSFISLLQFVPSD